MTNLEKAYWAAANELDAAIAASDYGPVAETMDIPFLRNEMIVARDAWIGEAA